MYVHCDNNNGTLFEDRYMYIVIIIMVNYMKTVIGTLL